MTLFFCVEGVWVTKCHQSHPEVMLYFFSVCIRFHRHDLARLRSKVIVTSTGRWTWQTSVRRWFLSLQGETSSFLWTIPRLCWICSMDADDISHYMQTWQKSSRDQFPAKLHAWRCITLSDLIDLIILSFTSMAHDYFEEEDSWVSEVVEF